MNYISRAPDTPVGVIDIISRNDREVLEIVDVTRPENRDCIALVARPVSWRDEMVRGEYPQKTFAEMAVPLFNDYHNHFIEQGGYGLSAYLVSADIWVRLDEAARREGTHFVSLPIEAAGFSSLMFRGTPVVLNEFLPLKTVFPLTRNLVSALKTNWINETPEEASESKRLFVNRHGARNFSFDRSARLSPLGEDPANNPIASEKDGNADGRNEAGIESANVRVWGFTKNSVFTAFYKL